MGQGVGVGMEGLEMAPPSAIPAQEDGPKKQAQSQVNVDFLLFDFTRSFKVCRKSEPLFSKVQGLAWSYCAYGP